MPRCTKPILSNIQISLWTMPTDWLSHNPTGTIHELPGPLHPSPTVSLPPNPTKYYQAHCVPVSLCTSPFMPSYQFLSCNPSLTVYHNQVHCMKCIPVSLCTQAHCMLHPNLTVYSSPPYGMTAGSGDSSVARAPDPWLKGHRFKSLQLWWENFLFQGQLSVLTLISVSVPPSLLP